MNNQGRISEDKTKLLERFFHIGAQLFAQGTPGASLIQEKDGRNSNKETEDNAQQLPPTPTTNGTEVAAEQQPNLTTPSPTVPSVASQPAPLQAVARVPPPEMTE